MSPPSHQWTSQRARQKAATRERILDGLVVQLAGGTGELSIEQLAAAVGVSPRTVYVHFPDRDALLDAIDERVNRELLLHHDCTTPEELIDATAAEFRDATHHAELLLAQLRGRVGREVRNRSRGERAEQARQALAPVLDGMPENSAREALAVLLLLRGADAWRVLHEDHGLDADGCARAIHWAMSLLVEDLRRQSGRP